MAKARRSIGTALELSEEERAFIHPAPATNVSTPRAQEPEPLPQGDASVSAEPEEEPHKASNVPKRSRGQRRRFQLPDVDEIALGTANLMAPVTTKLYPETFAALKLASTRQRLLAKTPGKVWEIVEEAIQDWLRKHDYV